MKRPQPQPQQAAAAAAAAAAAEHTMALYDACWFRRLVLLPSPATPAAAAAAAHRPALPAQHQASLEREREVDTTHTPQRPSSSPTAAGDGGLRHRRTRSDEATTAAFQFLEPLRLPLPDNGNRARLETILSGKDGLVVAAPAAQPLPERRRPELARRPAGSGRRRRRRGRSMSELEFEEVKGLEDLGFTFSDAEVDAELASIVPGLRRKRSEEENSRAAATASAPASSAFRARAEAANDDDASAVAVAAPRRPYLSEAWDDEEEEVRRALRNWRIPPAGDGNELKEHLRMWAHTVASAVR